MNDSHYWPGHPVLNYFDLFFTYVYSIVILLSFLESKEIALERYFRTIAIGPAILS